MLLGAYSKRNGMNLSWGFMPFLVLIDFLFFPDECKTIA